MTRGRRAAVMASQAKHGADLTMRPTGGVSSDPQTALVNSKPIQQGNNWMLAGQTERAFQAQVIRYARLMGWTAWHDHDSRKNAAGLPDLILVRRPRIVWAELKSERGRLRPAQRAWIDELRACGQSVHVWRPSDWEEIERCLK